MSDKNEGARALSRRNALKRGALGALGVAGVGLSLGTGTASAYHSFNQDSNDTDLVGDYNFEIGAAVRESTDETTNPVGITWACDLNPPFYTWHEIRNLEVTMEPYWYNASDDDWFRLHNLASELDDESDIDADLRAAIEAGTAVLSNLGYIGLLTMAPGDGDADTDTRDGGSILVGEWPVVRGNDYDDPVTGGIEADLSLAADPYYGDPTEGTYYYEVTATGDLWYVGYTGSQKVDEFEVSTNVHTEYNE